MPKTKRRIVKRNNTRKNDKQGGATKIGINKREDQPRKFGNRGREWLARKASSVQTAVQFDATKIYTKILSDFNYNNLTKIFKIIDEPNNSIDNYSKYKKYMCDEYKILIQNKNKNKDEPINSCIEGVFSINGFILNESEQKLILFIKKSGYSAIFHSDNFNFNIKNTDN
jgi:hypothetical protein